METTECIKKTIEKNYQKNCFLMKILAILMEKMVFFIMKINLVA